MNPGLVKIGTIALDNVNRISQTTITGTLNIPSESGTGLQNLNVQLSTSARSQRSAIDEEIQRYKPHDPEQEIFHSMVS